MPGSRAFAEAMKLAGETLELVGHVLRPRLRRVCAIGRGRGHHSGPDRGRVSLARLKDALRRLVPCPGLRIAFRRVERGEERPAAWLGSGRRRRRLDDLRERAIR